MFLLCYSRYSSRNLSSPIKTNIHFSLSRSGILSLDRADAVIEITEWVEVPRKNLTIENSTVSSNVSAESAAGNSSEENNESVQTDSGINKTSNISSEEQAAAEPATEKKLKKRTFRVPLKVKANWPPLFCDYLNWLVIFGNETSSSNIIFLLLCCFCLLLVTDCREDNWIWNVSITRFSC